VGRQKTDWQIVGYPSKKNACQPDSFYAILPSTRPYRFIRIFLFTQEEQI